jgi:hypothetical protein
MAPHHQKDSKARSQASGSKTAERRIARRKPSEATLEARIEACTLPGTVDNTSKTGILFFTGEELRVQLEIREANGRTSHRSGRLVRMQRLQPGQNGWAVEFDPA